ncbi:hypothetical protein ACFUNF_17640 [Streptomyces sp. NPDC057291]
MVSAPGSPVRTAAWNSKTDAEKQAARDSGKMKDPKSAMEYLGVS